MTAPEHSDLVARARRAAGLISTLAPLVLVCIGCSRGKDSTFDATLLHTVHRGDLVITVRERGEIKAAQNTRVLSEVEGRVTLIQLVPEGTVVAAGDIVATLDTSALAEKRATEEITVAKADAGVLQARKAVEIMERELRAQESARESELEIARLRARKLIGQPRSSASVSSLLDSGLEGTNGQVIEELRRLITDGSEAGGPEADPSNSGAADGRAGPPSTDLGLAAAERTLIASRPSSDDLLARVLKLFDDPANLALQMGEMGNQILQQLSAINLSRADLELATETLRYSEQLSSQGFLSRGELNRDRIDHQRRLAGMSLAWSNLELLVTYTLPEQRITTRQAVADAELALESQRALAEARRVRESSELARAEAELEIARQNLVRIEGQLLKGVLRAPNPGLVVYGRYDWDEPVYEGIEIRERQEVVVLPDISKMVAELLVPEAQVDLIAAGQRARLVVDAFPGKEFLARVETVSTLPDVQGSWRRDVKVYGVRVIVEGGNPSGALRPGMNATVEVEVGTRKDVLTVPLPALERSGDRHFVWSVNPEGPKALEVEVGRNSLTHIEVLSGLTEGMRVHLVPPDGARLPAPDRRERSGDGESDGTNLETGLGEASTAQSGPVNADSVEAAAVTGAPAAAAE